MRRQLVPGLVVRLTVIKAKTRPGIEARSKAKKQQILAATIETHHLKGLFPENRKIFNIRSTELKLWLLKDVQLPLLCMLIWQFRPKFNTKFIAKQEIRMDCAWELDNPLYELLANC